MSNFFQITHKVKDSGARVGLINTFHGVVETPAFIFCGTKATVKSVLPDQIRNANTQIILSNTYHLMIQPGEEIIADEGGLQNFTKWRGPMMTDSGGYQIFSLGHGSVSEEIKGKNPNSKRKSLIKINEEGDDATQIAIIDAHIKNNKMSNVIMDRCIVDGYVYTNWLHSRDKVKEETYDYAWSTFNEIFDDLDIIFYCTPLSMKNDGERSTDTNFQKDIDDMMKYILFEDPWLPMGQKVIRLENKSVDNRFNDIKMAIEEHEHTTVR